MTKIELSKELKIRDTLALAFGCMIGWGWVVLVDEWILRSGTFGAVFGFVSAGIVLTIVGLLYAELAAAMPKAGGAQIYSMRAFGKNMAFICGWSLILCYISVTIFEAVALPQVAEYIVGDLKHIPLWSIAGNDVYLSSATVGAIGSAVIGYINIRGVKTSAVFQTSITAVILIAGILLMTGSVGFGVIQNAEPLFVGGVAGSVIAVMVMAPFMMGGFDVIPQAASEINLEPKKIGNLIVVAVIVGTIWYCCIILAVSLLFNNDELVASSLPAVDAAGKAWGDWGRQLLVLGGLAGILTSWNGFMVGGSRAIYALANAGLLPRFLSKIHPKYHTPYNAIIVIALIGCAAPFLGRQLLVWISNAGSLGFVIAYVMVALSFIQLRRKEPTMPRPFKTPGGMLTGILGLVGTVGLCILYLPGSPGALLWPHEWIIIICWYGLGVIYLFFTHHIKRNKPSNI